MPNKRTGQDYLEAEMHKRNKQAAKEYHEKARKKEMDKYLKSRTSSPKPELRDHLLRGKGAPMVPIGTAPRGKKAKPVPMSKRKKK